MPIVKDTTGIDTAEKFVVIGVGSASSRCVVEISRILPIGGEVIAVNRSIDDMRDIQRGKRVAIGYPLYGNRAQEMNVDDADLVDESDLLRLKAAIGRPSKIFILANCGGAATYELIPSVIRVSMESGASVMTIVTTPFEFEGRARKATAKASLDRIRETKCPMAWIDADKVLSNVTQIGNLADELASAQARVLMTVLTASDAGCTGSLGDSQAILDRLRETPDLFVSYASTENLDESRKLARDAVRKPLTSGMELQQANRVGIIISGSPDLPIKVLNSAMDTVQKEINPDALLTTSFMPIPNSAGRQILRISILAGRRPEAIPQIDETPDAEKVETKELLINIATPDSSVMQQESFGDDLVGAPEWLIDSGSSSTNETMRPVLF